MPYKYASCAILATTLFRGIVAQQSTIIPQDLSAGFASSGVQVQVSYDKDAVDGFADGTTFNSKDVANVPTFALGDSSGIATNTIYTILLVDTTCDNARTLHFVQANFAFEFDITNIDSSSAPLLAYQAPGAFKETGDDRKYSFLMYDNPENKNITTLKLPAQGAAFDAKSFQDDNGFEDAVAGVGMVVKLGGTANCGASTSGGGSNSASPSSVAISSAAAASSSGPASQASTNAPTSQAPSGTPAATTKKPANSPASTSVAAAASSGISSQSATATDDSAQSSGLLGASSVIESAPAAQSTVFMTSIAPNTAGTSTASGSAALQTGEAPAVSFTRAQGVVMAGVVALAGWLAS